MQELYQSPLAHDGKFTAGATLGLFDGELILSVHLPMEGLDAESFGVKLTAFADAAVSVRAEIAAAAVAGDDGGKGGDKELEDYVLEIAPSLCLNSNNNLRSNESIQKKMALRAWLWVPLKQYLPQC